MAAHSNVSSKVTLRYFMYWTAPNERLRRNFSRRQRNRNGLLNGEPYAAGTIGAPVLENLGAYLECKSLDILEKHGDHAIVVLEVLEAVLRKDVEPLTVTGSPWQYGG